MSTTTATGAKIEIRGLTKRFGSFVAVDDLSFDVEPGRITGFLGPNGAGKTTTLRMLLGLVHSDRAARRRSTGSATSTSPRRSRTVGAALEATNFHPGRSGRDHLRVLRGRRLDPAHAGRRAARARPASPPRPASAPASTRMGMRQRLGLAAALLGDPQVLVLDEPSNGLDPEGIRWLRGFLRHLSRRGQDDPGLQPPPAGGRADRRRGRHHRQRPPGAVRVDPPTSRAPRARSFARRIAGRLAGALRVADVTSTPGNDGTLIADTTDLRLIGDVALRAGLPIYGLEPQKADLEALFFELTEGTNRNEAPRRCAPRARMP